MMKINGDRHWGQMMTMAEIGATPKGGGSNGKYLRPTCWKK